jgi:isoamylase
MPLENPPVLWDIESDPVLAGTKLIAEAWDPGGLYQVGSFIGDSWKEWNGRFRDDVRSFLKGDNGTVARLAFRLMGSPDLYGGQEREPEQSINFVTCHDGLTLNDLVSYNQKHNEANGEANRDGSNDNLSWNCGVEGPTDDPDIEELRRRQIKNFFAVLLISLGAPMISMGDEVRRTQRGNNNAYCQDNEISWFDWTLVTKHRDLFRFVKRLIFSRVYRDISIEDYRTSLNQVLRQARFQWHGVKLNQPDWSDSSHSRALTAFSIRGRFVFHIMLNAYWEPLEFELPPLEDGNLWRRLLDTALPSPCDIAEGSDAPVIDRFTYAVQARSVVVLVSRTPGRA